MIDEIKQQLTALASTLIAYIPSLLAGLALLLVGWLLAKVLRLLAVRLLTTINKLLDRLLSGGALDFVRISPAATGLLSAIVYWATILVFATIAIRVLGLSGVAVWLEQIVIYLPSLAAGAVIIVSGLILGNIVKNIVTHAAASIDLAQAPTLGHLAQIGTIAIALIIGLDQIGLDLSFLVILLAIVLAAVLLGFSLAFALGATELIKNLIATQHLKPVIQLGQIARVGELEGRLIEFAPTGLILETAAGKTLVSGSVCLRESLTVVAEEVTDE